MMVKLVAVPTLLQSSEQSMDYLVIYDFASRMRDSQRLHIKSCMHLMCAPLILVL